MGFLSDLLGIPSNESSSGHTEKVADFCGNEKEIHYDEDGRKIGETHFKKDYLGKTKQEHFNREGKKIGSTVRGENLLGQSRAEHFDERGRQIGTTEGRAGIWGSYQAHVDEQGREVGSSTYEQTVFGGSFKRHRGKFFKATCEGQNASGHAQPGESGTYVPGAGLRAPSTRGPVIAFLAISGIIVLGASGTILQLLRQMEFETSTPTTSIRPTARTFTWRLLPVDEAHEDPSFLQFRQGLLVAIDRRDRSFLMSVISPTIGIGFGDEPNTAQEFARQWNLDAANSSIWNELGRIMRMGGAFTNFQGRRQFIAPYVASSWPENVDSFSYSAVIAPSVRLYAGPGIGTKPIGTLSYDLVKVGDWTADHKWVRVSTHKGLTGYINANAMRSPISLRAAFERINGRWVMVSLVSGD